MDQQCFCKKDSKEINCMEDEGVRIQTIDNDFESTRTIAGSINGCIYGMRAAIQCGATQFLDKFEPFQFISNEEISNQREWVSDLKKQSEDPVASRMAEYGLPIKEIIFTA